jgi:hypothetical protein
VVTEETEVVIEIEEATEVDAAEVLESTEAALAEAVEATGLSVEHAANLNFI